MSNIVNRIHEFVSQLAHYLEKSVVQVEESLNLSHLTFIVLIIFFKVLNVLILVIFPFLHSICDSHKRVNDLIDDESKFLQIIAVFISL